MQLALSPGSHESDSSDSLLRDLRDFPPRDYCCCCCCTRRLALLASLFASFSSNFAGYISGSVLYIFSLTLLSQSSCRFSRVTYLSRLLLTLQLRYTRENDRCEKQRRRCRKRASNSFARGATQRHTLRSRLYFNVLIYGNEKQDCKTHLSRFNFKNNVNTTKFNSPKQKRLLKRIEELVYRKNL